MANKRSTERKEKRGQGEWCFYEQKNGNWTARKQFGRKENGKPNIVALYGGKGKDGLRDVKRKVKVYEEKLATNQNSACKTTLYDYISKWLEVYKKQSVKSTTYDTLEDTIEVRIKPYPIANIQIANLTIDICQEYINQLTTSKRKYSLATITKTYNTINSCLRLAVGKGDIQKNPMEYVVLPSEANVQSQQRNINFFTPEQAKLLCDEARKKHTNGEAKYYYGNAIVLMLHTGMRIGECLGLRWQDVDFENRTILVDNTISTIVNRDEAVNKKTVLIDTSPKTEKSARVIPMSDKAKEALIAIRDNTKTKITKSSYIIVTKNGNIASARNVRRAFDRLLEICNIPNQDYGLHSLRHTFVSILLAKGVDIKIISDLVGHEKVSTTYNIYAHLMPKQKETSVKLLDDI